MLEFSSIIVKYVKGLDLKYLNIVDEKSFAILIFFTCISSILKINEGIFKGWFNEDKLVKYFIFLQISIALNFRILSLVEFER